jgi:hypothetical protein
MNEDRFDELMRDAAHTYRKPPVADFDEMWNDIARRAPVIGGQELDELAPLPAPKATRRFPAWIAIAATLVIGVGLGRVSAFVGHSASPSTVAQVAVAPVVATPRNDSTASSASVNSYEGETSKYLGQTAALLIALPSEVKSGRANQQFVGRAGELLTTTRLLIDSPAADDPQMRNLLEDLELVLAQVVRLQNNNSRTELDLINRALEQRDVLPRLRTAVASNTAN